MSKIGERLSEIEEKVTERIKLCEKEFNEKISEFKKELAAQFEKVESELAISKNANAILKAEVDTQRKGFNNSIIQIERESQRTAQYIQYETLEVSNIPITIPDKEVQNVVLKLVNSLKGEDDDDIGPADIQACHRRQGKYHRENGMARRRTSDLVTEGSFMEH